MATEHLNFILIIAVAVLASCSSAPTTNFPNELLTKKCNERPAIAAIGGFNKNNHNRRFRDTSYLSSIEVFDANTTQQWQLEKARLPNGMSGFIAATLGEDLFVFGGDSYSRTTYSWKCRVRHIECYHEPTEWLAWSSFTPVKLSKQADRALNRQSAASVQNKLTHELYVVGGEINYNRSNTASFSTYNLLSENLIVEPQFPTNGRYLKESSAAASSQLIFVTGGLEGIDRRNDPTDHVYKYDPLSSQWSQLESMWYERAYHASVYVDEFVYVCGGSNAVYGDMNKCEKYDIGNNEWIPIAPMMEVRTEHAMIAINNTVIMACGGIDKMNIEKDSCEYYIIAQNKWLPAPSMNVGRTDF